jgi:L-amino acid N-acyltransferase YncA
VLSEAARENGFTGLIAYMLASNTAMIKLFKKLPYEVNATFEGDTLVLRCNFDEGK